MGRPIACVGLGWSKARASVGQSQRKSAPGRLDGHVPLRSREPSKRRKFPSEPRAPVRVEDPRGADSGGEDSRRRWVLDLAAALRPQRLTQAYRAEGGTEFS